MAGMLPGVELARRRRTHHHEACLLSRDSSELSSLRRRNGPSSMDESALRARSRLEQKLRCPSSRLNDKKHERMESRSPDSSTRSSNENRAGMFKEVKWQVPTRKSQKEVCSICLDEFKAQQAVMNLPCSHRYHSKCLLPWLSVHSLCPYCRTTVQC